MINIILTFITMIQILYSENVEIVSVLSIVAFIVAYICHSIEILKHINDHEIVKKTETNSNNKNVTVKKKTRPKITCVVTCNKPMRSVTITTKDNR